MSEKTKIDWTDSTWNPVTGCLHGCPYCYARKIARRFCHDPWNTVEDGICHFVGLPMRNEFYKNNRIDPYPYGFDPTFHYYRLDEPQHIKKPKNIFICSMADLFGEWVPDEWIQEVFKACEAAPQHRYLFLTKNPKRYKDFFNEISGKGYWLGSTATTCKADVMYDTSGFQKTFISAEPIMEDISPLINDGAYESVDWLIIGAETGNRKDKIIPKKEWIQSIVETCRSAGIPIFMKKSLRQLMGDEFIQEFPW